MQAWTDASVARKEHEVFRRTALAYSVDLSEPAKNGAEIARRNRDVSYQQVGRFGLNAHWSCAVRLQKPSAGGVEAAESDAGHFRLGVRGCTLVPDLRPAGLNTATSPAGAQRQAAVRCDL